MKKHNQIKDLDLKIRNSLHFTYIRGSLGIKSKIWTVLTHDIRNVLGERLRTEIGVKLIDDMKNS